MNPIQELIAYQRGTEALTQSSAFLHWDLETCMPSGSVAQRSDVMAELAEIIHSRTTSPRIAEWIDAIEPDELSEIDAANLRLIRREFERSSRIPVELETELARLTARAHLVWAGCRRNDDPGDFLPLLEEIVRLKREQGLALATDDDIYGALLDVHEPGATTAETAKLFGRLREGLVQLIDRIRGSACDPAVINGVFPTDKQLALARELAGLFLYNFEEGRVDLVEHPFCVGSGSDVRITTRVDESNPFDCLYAIIHETGHGVYEQNVDRRFLLTPIGKGASLGVHESQSRMFENQLARGRPFTSWLFCRMQEVFGDLGIPDKEAFYASINRFGPGYIRTEADEVQYNLHIILRFEIERALIRDDLQVGDIEGTWNDMFESYFGFAVDKPSNGFLQDVHWAYGAFGYFPTYSFGNIYAGCIHHALEQAIPELDAQLEIGDPGPAVRWLQEKIHVHGSLKEPVEVVENACGEKPSEKRLLDYLERKFGQIYDFA